MKRIALTAFACMMVLPGLFAQTAAKKAPVKKTMAAPAPKTNEIHWITDFNELQEKMAKEPRKVYVDIYTDWCGWCKKMDASTFSNPEVIKYMNINYYAFKFNAERQDPFVFQGKQYSINPQAKANSLAVEWLKGEMMYPTAVIMMENFQNPMPLKGYMDVKQLETVLTYYGDNVYKHQNGADYQRTYKPGWEK